MTAEQHASATTDTPVTTPTSDDGAGRRRAEGLSGRQILKRTIAEFGSDQCTDLAAALTYYAVLAVFPGLIALLSLVGVFGQSGSSVTVVLDVLRPLVGASTYDTIEGPVRDLAGSQAAGLGLVVGLVGALVSASGYVGAFGRAMNKIYEVEEGRPFWKLRPTQILLTLVTVVLIAAALLMLIVSGPVTQAIGDAVGAGGTARSAWEIAKWPVLLLVVVLLVALLYHFSPNVRPARFRWITVGAVTAIGVWLVASVGFGFYVANFGSYNKTYGSVAGVVVALLWVWLTNNALLFGAELDSELERNRELRHGIAAEENLQLPLRDDRQIAKGAKKHAALVATARQVRERAPS